MASGTTAAGQNAPPRAAARSRARLWHVGVLAAIALLPVLLLAPFVNAPFERDEAVYAIVGEGLLHGATSYKDLFDHKPPGVHLWYALSFLAFGETVLAPRLLAMVFASASALAVFSQANALISRRAAYVSAALMAATAGLVTLRAVANAEVFTTLPAVLALLVATRGLMASRDSTAGGWRWLLVAGALSGVAVLTKQVVLLQTAAIGAVVLIASPHRLKDVCAFVGGGFAVLAIVVTPFLIAGAWDDFWYANFTYNRLYFAADGPDAAASLTRYVITAAPLLILAAAGAVSLVARARRPEHVLVLLWSIASLLSVFSTGRAYDHYWVMTFPALALLAGYAVDSWSDHRGQGWIVARIGLVFVVGMTAVGTLLLNARAYQGANADQRHIAQYGDVGERDVAAMVVAERVADLLGPGEQFYDVGRETAVYFYADVLPPIRFMFDRQFYLDPVTLEEALVDLKADAPELILLTRPLDDPPYSDGTVAVAEIDGRLLPPAFADFVRERYVFLEEIEFARVYRLVQ